MNDTKNTPPLKLLIVEDDMELQTVLREITETTLNCSVTCRNNGALALELIEKAWAEGNPFDAILTDIKMPVMDGITMLAAIRSKEIYTPVIVLTGHGDKESTIRALQLGAHDFIEKPCDVNSLIARLKSALELGASFRTIDSELDQIISELSLPPEDEQKIRKIKKNLLIAKKKSMAA